MKVMRCNLPVPFEHVLLSPEKDSSNLVSVIQAPDSSLCLCSAFFECADNMGVLEWNTVTNTFVHFFSNITGYVSVAPGDDEVLVVGYDSNVNVLKPQGEIRFRFWHLPCLCFCCMRCTSPVRRTRLSTVGASGRAVKCAWDRPQCLSRCH